jgi:hypothetical protein
MCPEINRSHVFQSASAFYLGFARRVTGHFLIPKVAKGNITTHHGRNVARKLWVELARREVSLSGAGEKEWLPVVNKVMYLRVP